MEDSYIIVDGVRVRYKKANEGSERKVVLLHGMAFNADTWDKIGTIEKLSKAGYGVYAIDIPGFGKSSGKRMRRWNAARFLAKILDKLSLSSVSLVGPSMGGGIALAFTILYQERVRGLILIAPAGLNDEEIISNLDRIKVPTLIFWGENDKVFPIELANYLNSKLNCSKLIICPRARHPCYLDTPELFNNKLIEFLNEVYGDRKC